MTVSDAAGGDGLRLLHWNIHSWVDPDGDLSNVDTVIALIREHQPHAVSLVEVDETWGEPSQLARVGDVTGYLPVFAPAFEYGSDQPTGGFGNAILTRLPILAVSHRQLTWPDTTYAGAEPSEPRVLLLVTLDSGAGATVTVGSTHLPWRDRDARAAALHQIKAITATLDGPWAILGDFNTPAHTWITDDEAITVEPRDVPTAPTSSPAWAIDYCIAGPDVTAAAEVLDAKGSDHLPVLVSARLQPAQKS